MKNIKRTTALLLSLILIFLTGCVNYTTDIFNTTAPAESTTAVQGIVTPESTTVSPVPESTTVPPVTAAPETTTLPPVTAAPETTTLPPESQVPESTTLPPVNQVPESTTLPL